MSLITFDDIWLTFGEQVIFRGADLVVQPSERVCLIGRNGAGKSTLLKLILGQLEPDRGEIRRRSELVVTALEQALPNETDLPVRAFVSEGLKEQRSLIDRYREQTKNAETPLELRELERLQRQIEAHGGWHVEQRVEAIGSDLDLPLGATLAELSGGWQRRVALARALVREPDILLLDEPTNHLDLATVEWLENQIKRFTGTVLFITHDRTFLDRVASRIVELDRGQLTSWECNFAKFLELRERRREEEARDNKLFDKKLDEEEAWIRQGIKARRTRNEGRVRALTAMREEHAQRIKPERRAKIYVQDSEQSSRRVIQARNVSYAFAATPVIDQFSIKIMRGDRIGLIGNNGVGKSTLLRLLLGELHPQTGTLKHGENLETAYFDQTRRHLDPEKTVAEIVGDGRDYIPINGKERHVVGYLRGFLFTAKRALTPVGFLSGGECNRVILAKLLSRPSNLLVLDEPTNDLDVETLEVLEEQLSEYSGTLLCVSHDRWFLDSVVTSTLVFETDGNINRYPGGYSDWQRQGQRLRETDRPGRQSTPAAKAVATKKSVNSTKLSYKLQRELESLPGRIEALETEIGELEVLLNEPGFYDQAFEITKPKLDDLANRRDDLETAMERWEELEQLQAQLKTS
ncbi:MAG: ATP-binding cassette domain-containing protein [Pseudomonadota bacterium]